jgi:hypothetical protein
MKNKKSRLKVKLKNKTKTYKMSEDKNNKSKEWGLT